MREQQENQGELSRRAVVAAGAVTAFTPAASLLPLDNFTAVHDDLNVRVLLVESGSRRIAPAVLDLTSISAEAVALMRDAITGAPVWPPRTSWSPSPTASPRRMCGRVRPRPVPPRTSRTSSPPPSPPSPTP